MGDLNLSELIQLQAWAKNYHSLEKFQLEHKKLSYVQFDYSIVHELTLFTIEPNLSFEDLQMTIDKILKALPAIKRIFAQPTIHLIDSDVILPVDQVRRINNDTLKHIAVHSEFWEDVTEDTIKPRQLLTKTYQDNYAIYENLVFCDLIDIILSFTRTNIRFLKEFIYTNQSIEINFLERVNHLDYFLALGKLHTGYSRNFEQYYSKCRELLTTLTSIQDAILPRLKRPVYSKNIHRNKMVKLRKTNILGMDKNYHQVYNLIKFFEDSYNISKINKVELDIDQIKKDYFIYAEALTIFSLAHFNFLCADDTTIDFDKLNINFNYKCWNINVQKINYKTIPLIALKIDSDVSYRIILVPTIDKDEKKLIKEMQLNERANEYVILTPFEEENSEIETYLDITNIESFRRLQQVVLRGMIYSDIKKEDCPFCQNKLTLNKEKSIPEYPVYTCESCRTEIGLKKCDETDSNFYYTTISDLPKKKINPKEESWLKKRNIESQMYFRNITDLNERGEIVCPHCHKPSIEPK